MTLYTFGDSHGGGYPDHGWSKILLDNISISIHWIGPHTCASFGVNKLSILDISKFGVTDGDIVCFSFGEIDVRSVDKVKDNYREFIDAIVLRYFKAIQLNVSQFNGLSIIVQCVTPVAERTDVFDENWPALGTDEERKIYTEYINSQYKTMCSEYRYYFLDYYKEYCNRDGFLDITLSDGHAHISEPKFIKLRLMEILNKI